ncbi:hypothetical protein YC2023_044789 [Brassica napus]
MNLSTRKVYTCTLVNKSNADDPESVVLENSQEKGLVTALVLFGREHEEISFKQISTLHPNTDWNEYAIIVTIIIYWSHHHESSEQIYLTGFLTNILHHMSSLSLAVSTHTENELGANRTKTVKLSDGGCHVRGMDGITLPFIFFWHLLETHGEWFSPETTRFPG